jgi:hypothetical protein
MSLTIQTREYSGIYANNMITEAIVGARTLQRGLVSVAEGVKSKIGLPIMRFDDGLIRARAATPSAGTGVTLTEDTIEPKDFMVYARFNPRNFEGSWMEDTLAPRLIERGLPPTFEGFLIEQMLAKLASEFDQLMWQGDEANSAERLNRFDGFIKQLHSSSNTIRPDGQVALTAANIEAELEKMYSEIPNAIVLNPSCKIVMAQKTWNVYRKAQQNQNGKGVTFAQDGITQFNGMPIEVNPFLPENTIVAGQFDSNAMMSNAFLARNNAADMNTVLIDKLTNDSELWFVKMLGKANVGIPKMEEMVLYSTWEPAVADEAQA